MYLNVTFLDVYHGDCAIITIEKQNKKSCIVVDGGETINAAKRIASYLKYENISIIDLLIGTHIDADHINGLKHLLNKESDKSDSWNKGKKKCIRYYWGPKPDPNWHNAQTLNQLNYRWAKSSGRATMNMICQSIQQNQDLHKLVKEYIVNKKNIYFPSLQDLPPLNILPNIKIELLAPDKQILDTEIERHALSVVNLPYSQNWLNNSNKGRLSLADFKKILDINARHMAEIADRTANNQSIVFRLSPKAKKSKKWSFLFTGDAEHESWDMININKYKKDLKAKVLKLPHHGSVNGIINESYETINPQIAIVSAGQKHGLPDAQILNMIKNKRSLRIFCTERNNNSRKPGPCVNKTNCPRGTSNDFRSLKFRINMSTGKCTREIFKFSSNNKNIILTQNDPWCPEYQW